MGEWWHDDCGQNLLAGDPADPDNPVLLDAEIIASLLATIQAARDSFERLVGNMLPAEQERLAGIAAGMPHDFALDYQKIEDDFQHRLNTASIRTTGPRGGGSWAPPPYKGENS